MASLILGKSSSILFPMWFLTKREYARFIRQKISASALGLLLMLFWHDSFTHKMTSPIPAKRSSILCDVPFLQSVKMQDLLGKNVYFSTWLTYDAFLA
jgi:hypothetical protein